MYSTMHVIQKAFRNVQKVFGKDQTVSDGHAGGGEQGFKYCDSVGSS